MWFSFPYVLFFVYDFPAGEKSIIRYQENNLKHFLLAQDRSV